MGVPRQLLHPGEEVLVDIRPHWTSLLGPLLATLVVVSLAVTLDIEIDHAPVAAHWAEGVAAALPCAWLVARFLRWRRTDLVVTNRRVLLRHGVVRRRLAQVSLDELTRVEVEQTLPRRLVGSGRLVAVAVVDGEETDVLVLEDVRRPVVLQRVIHRRLRRPDGAMPYPPGYRPGPTGPTGPPGPRPAGPARPPSAPPPG